jgi:ribosome maturation factor RimP
MDKLQIKIKIEEIVSSLGFLLIDIIFRGDQHLRVLEIFIDGEKGITTTDCSNVSRAINEAFLADNLIEENYRLEVSSPGVERPLKYLVQFSKHIGRKFELEYIELEETKKLIAKLLRIEGDQLYFEEKNFEVKINFQNIIKAKVLISF